MHITLNGKVENVADGATMAELLARFQHHPVRVAVELNEEIVARKRFADTRIQNGDRIEVVAFVGGG